MTATNTICLLCGCSLPHEHVEDKEQETRYLVDREAFREKCIEAIKALRTKEENAEGYVALTDAIEAIRNVKL